MVNRYGLGYSAPVVETTEGAKAMVDALLGSDKEAKTKAFAQIDLALRAPFDERFGKSNDILKRVIDHAQKSNTPFPSGSHSLKQAAVAVLPDVSGCSDPETISFWLIAIGE